MNMQKITMIWWDIHTVEFHFLSHQFLYFWIFSYFFHSYKLVQKRLKRSQNDTERTMWQEISLKEFVSTVLFWLYSNSRLDLLFHITENLHILSGFAIKIDLASGSSIDWAYGVADVPITFTFEFRDKGIFHLAHI